ncbi:hypothetical protein [Maricaulis sp.]|uniref:hypothetical protein n=1 Tax=Maricaulis sp. TaxID=1486257 RepID=UPI00262B9F0C|nr:hypothetical protein [Maricaulis sp.]
MSTAQTRIRPHSSAGAGRKAPVRGQKERPVQGAKPLPPVKLPAFTTQRYLSRQILNAKRNLAAMESFKPDGFGRGAEAPSAAHIHAVNQLLDEARARLREKVGGLAAMGAEAASSETGFAGFLNAHDAVIAQIKELETLRAFYAGMFEQRTGDIGQSLLGLDRIARDCYQAIWLNIGRPRSLPAPVPFCYVEDGRGPATYRRGVKLTVLGKRPNPFPLVKLPQHRLINPWTLGAIPHEVAHNLQNDLGLWKVLPSHIRKVMRGVVPDSAAAVWARWHKESYADLCGVLLIGPAYVESLIDIVGKAPRKATTFNPTGVHPTPIVRVLMNCELLRRMGFAREAEQFRTTWRGLYPGDAFHDLPEDFRTSLGRGMAAMVEAICFSEKPEYGGKKLSKVVSYDPGDQVLVAEAASRLLKGMNTGILPERFLIAASRQAIARPGAKTSIVARNFFKSLGRG